MSISNDDAQEITEALKRASFGSFGDQRIIYLEAALAAVWNSTENDGRPPEVENG